LIALVKIMLELLSYMTFSYAPFWR